MGSKSPPWLHYQCIVTTLGHELEAVLLRVYNGQSLIKGGNLLLMQELSMKGLILRIKSHEKGDETKVRGVYVIH